MPQLSDCCVGKVIQHHLTFRPYPPHHLSFCSHSVHKHIWCMLVCVCVIMFVCREMMWYPVSDLPFLPTWLQSRNILCICMSDVRLAFIFFIVDDLSSYTHAQAHTHTRTQGHKAGKLR